MYKGVARIFVRYWRAYGGARVLLSSPYLHLAAVITGVCAATWLKPDWWDQPIAVLPNLLGFTLGGFAMFLGFGDEKFRQLLAEHEDGEKTGIYVAASAMFVHFILAQVLALLYAIVAKALWFPLPWCDWLWPYVHGATAVAWGFGYLFFIYAFTSLVAATMQIFRVATWYEMHQSKQRDGQ